MKNDVKELLTLRRICDKRQHAVDETFADPHVMEVSRRKVAVGLGPDAESVRLFGRARWRQLLDRWQLR